MACRRPGTAWRRAGSHVLHNPVVLLLVVVGVALIATALVLGPEARDTARPLGHLGVWVVVLAVLVPLGTEVSVGPGGLKLKTAVRERKAEYEAALDRHEPTTIRLAELLVGDPGRARQLAEQAWAQAYAAWHTLGAEHVRPFVVCTLARLAVRTSWTPPRDPPAEEATWLELLGSLPPHTRAAVLLHDYELVRVRRIARILDWDEQGVRAALAARDRAAVTSGAEGDQR